MVTTTTWTYVQGQSLQIRGVRALIADLASIEQEIIHAKSTSKVQRGHQWTLKNSFVIPTRIKVII